MRFPGHGMGWKEFFVALKTEWKRDKVSDTAGAVVFFALLAIFPFLLFVISLASLVIDPKSVDALLGQVAAAAPPQVSQILRERILSLIQGGGTGILTFGGAAAVWAASSGMVAVMSALNTVYGVEESRPFWKVRLIALGMTLVTAVLAIGAAFLAVATPAIASHLPSPLGTVLQWLRLPIAGVVMMFLWALLYYALPAVEQRFRFISPGAVVGVVLWVLSSWGFSVYVTNFGKYEATYGALGGVVVMLVWMWISAQVLLLGAEINAVIEHKSPEGKRAGATSLAEKGVSGTKSEEEARGGRLAGPVPVRRGRGSGAGRAASALKRALVASAVGAAYLFGRRDGRAL